MDMAQFVIRNLEEDVKRRLKRRAKRHGQSLEAEVRDILRHAVRAESSARGGLGSRIAVEFAGHGLKEGEIPTLSGAWARPVNFKR